MRLDIALNPLPLPNSGEIFANYFGKKPTPSDRKSQLEAKNILSSIASTMNRQNIVYADSIVSLYLGIFDYLKSIGCNKIAVSKKESIDLQRIAKSFYGDNCFEIQIDSKCNVSLHSLQEAIKQGAEAFFVSETDYELFIVESLENIKHTIKDALLISDVSFGCAPSKYTDIPFVRGDRITAGTKASVFCFDKKTKNIDLSGVDLFALASLHYGIKQKTELKITDTKQRVINALKTVFGDDLIFFIEPDKTFKNGFAFGLKGIKAGEFVYIMSLDGIMITNGEGCNAMTKEPSFVLRAAGYDIEAAREMLSFSFTELSDSEIAETVSLLGLRYRQHKALSIK